MHERLVKRIEVMENKILDLLGRKFTAEDLRLMTMTPPLDDRELFETYCFGCYQLFLSEADQARWEAFQENLPSELAALRHYHVRSASYGRHEKKRGKGYSFTLRTAYESHGRGVFYVYQALEHRQELRDKAALWWRRLTKHPLPQTVDDAVEISRTSRLEMPSRVIVRTMTPYEDWAVAYDFDPKSRLTALTYDSLSPDHTRRQVRLH